MFKIFRERLSDCLYYHFMNILMEIFPRLSFNGCWENLEGKGGVYRFKEKCYLN